MEKLLRIFRALQTSQVLLILMNAQLTYEPIVNLHYSKGKLTTGDRD